MAQTCKKMNPGENTCCKDKGGDVRVPKYDSIFGIRGFFSFVYGFLFERFFKPKENCPPVVPGLPIVGNLLQLKEKKPHHAFTQWAKEYGPIYSIRTGALPLVVINTTQLAKEAMVTKFSSISSRKLSNALRILTLDKTMVAMSDYGDYHHLVKKLLLRNLLGPAALKQNRILRENMLQRMIDSIYSDLKAAHPESPEGLDVRQNFITELFPFSMIEIFGRDVESVHVEEMGRTLSKWEIYDILVIDPMKGAIEVDWRDFFPYLSWVPFKHVQENMTRMHIRREAVLKALIQEQRQLLASGKEANCYLDILLLDEAHELTDEQVRMSIWEPIIETSDTTLVTVEWAMFELSKNAQCQDRLYQELQAVCGDESVTEHFLPKLPYLNAVFHETLRKHPPVPILPLRFVHEDVELGGFHIPAGCQIAINVYGCHNDEKQWENPEEWNPERFVGVDKQVMELQRTMAFGAGKRVCAGAAQAQLIACTTIGRFVQEFRWELLPGEEESVDTVTLTTHKLHPLKAIVSPRR